jgi:serine/threonine protein kinase
MAPEALCGAAVDTKSDIFSVGVTLLEMCTGKLPTPTAPRAVGVSGRMVMVPELTRRKHELDSVTQGAALCDLIRSCLDQSRSARPSATQLLQQLLALRDDAISQPADTRSVDGTDEIERLRMQVLQLQQQVSSVSSSATSSPGSTGSFRMTAFGTAPVPEHGRSSDVDVFGDWQEEKPVLAPSRSAGQEQMPSF